MCPGRLARPTLLLAVVVTLDCLDFPRGLCEQFQNLLGVRGRTLAAQHTVGTCLPTVRLKLKTELFSIIHGSNPTPVHGFDSFFKKDCKINKNM